MPFDTDLTVPNASEGGGGFATQNPLGLLNTLMDIRGKGIEQQNQQTQGQRLQIDLQLQQKQMLARQLLGQTLSGAKSTDEGLNASMQNPEIAPYVTQEFGQIREGLLANQRFQNERQSAAISGYDNLLKGLGVSAGDPDRFNSAVKAGLDLVPESSRALVESATKDTIGALTNGLPTAKDMPGATPEEVQGRRKAAFQARTVGWAAAHGLTPDLIKSIYGEQGMQDTGSGFQPFTRTPVQGGQEGQPGGSISLSGPEIPKGLAPEATTSPGGGRVEYPAVPPAQVGKGGVDPKVAGPALVQRIPPPEALASDGKPLVADPIAHVSTTFDRAGQPVLTGPTALGAAERMKEFEGPELQNFQLTQTGLARAKEMDTAMDNLARGGGWQTPGPAGDARNAIAAFANTFAQMTGQKLPFDPSKVESWEQFNKDSMPAALSVLAQHLGQQREAAMTIQSVMRSVPTIENTYLGGKLVNASMIAMFQRAADERNYVDYVRKINGGDIQSAIENFNKEHPAEATAEAVLNKFGLVHTERGAEFPSLSAIKTAKDQGLLTLEDAKRIAQDYVKNYPDKAKKELGGGK